MTLVYILLAILLLGVLITVHEFGHFAASRLCGIAVKEFSIGFGPKLIQKKSKKHETLFSLRPIPLGGYCMYYGDDEKKEDPRNFSNAPVWKRIIAVLSGPLMNIVLAFFAAVILMSAYGYSITSPYIVSVDEGMPAQAAGLQAGDIFVSIAGEAMQGRTVTDASSAIAAAGEGETLSIVISRGGEEQTCELQPVYDEEYQRWRVGVTIQQGYERIKAVDVLPSAWSTCQDASVAILNALGKLVTTGEGFNDTAGPIGVVQLVAEQTQQGGLEVFLYLAVIISINLGLVNLLPIPGLDGSRLVFMLIELIRRKPVSQRVESVVHLCGYTLLLGLMLFFTFKDVMRIFGK